MVTAVLLIVAAVPWLAPFIGSIKFGPMELTFRELQKATQEQTAAALHQTVATVITWVQAEPIRESRRLLREMEKKKRISKMPAIDWQEDWKQAADQVSQAFNSAAIIAKQDQRLQKVWIQPTRRAIVWGWDIVQPRTRERRQEEADIWEDFDWLATEAKKYWRSGDDPPWGLTPPVQQAPRS